MLTSIDGRNPSQYSAVISDASVLLSYGVLPIGYLIIHRLTIQPGSNDIQAVVRYSPVLFNTIEAGEAMLSSYLSERPTNISLSFHQQSFPAYPELSKALAKSNVTFQLPIPQLQSPYSLSSPSRFLIEAKFHVFSSTASFTLRNPLNTTITITHLSAFAIYHDDVIGRLRYDYPILLHPSTNTETTRLSVKWSLPASDILRRVIGGTLKVNATANATVSIGKMHDIHLQLALQDVGAGVGI